MKKTFIIALLIIFSCGTQLNIPTSKSGKSFYAGSIKEGIKAVKMFDWELTHLDTIKQKDGRNIYLFHYKNLNIK